VRRVETSRGGMQTDTNAHSTLMHSVPCVILRSTQHSLQHLAFDNVATTSWTALMQGLAQLPQLRTLRLGISVHSIDPVMVRRFVDAILLLEEALFPKLREIRITWKQGYNLPYLPEDHANMLRDRRRD
jgi:hypothetical protein